jgi:integron integrase
MNESDAIRRMIEVIRLQHKALATESCYVHWLRHFMLKVKQMPPSLSSEQKLERFLTELAVSKDLAASTQNQAFNAIAFFYKDVLGKPLQNVESRRAVRPLHLRHAPTVSQTRALLQAVPDVAGYATNLIARLLYGCGLRVTEPLNLRIKDLNLDKGILFILGAKGGKDRVVSLPHSLRAELGQQLEFARAAWLRDKQNGIPVETPHQLAAKYRQLPFTWTWAWLFPSRSVCRHPRTGLCVRYRMHEANVQRAIKAACQRLEITVLPHELRHAYATHCLERGTNPRAIQKAMGHESLETTMRYLHADSLSVHSPLETTLNI